MISKSQLGNLYESRRQFNEAVVELFGNQLHDISQQDSDRSTNSINKHTQKATSNKQIISQRIADTNNVLNNHGFKADTNYEAYKSNAFKIQTNSNLNDAHASLPNMRKGQKFEDFLVNVNYESKLQKTYKQNVELQKKIMNIKQQVQACKYKVSLWEKVKQFILATFDKQYKLKSIKFGSSDSAILQQFLNVVQQVLINKSDNKAKNHLDRIVDHTACRQVQEDFMKKLQAQCTKSASSLLQIEILKSEVHSLQQKLIQQKKQRKEKINQRQSGIHQNLQQSQKSLIKQNALLHQKLMKMQSQLLEIKNNFHTENKISDVSNANKTISTNVEKSMKSVSTIQSSEIQSYKKMCKSKDMQIQNLMELKILLESQIQNLRGNSQKMKKIIKLAQIINNQFIKTLQKSFRTNLNSINASQQAFNNYFEVAEPSNINLQNNQFHMVNKRFKIVKSKSVEKSKLFLYGKTQKY